MRLLFAGQQTSLGFPYLRQTTLSCFTTQELLPLTSSNSTLSTILPHTPLPLFCIGRLLLPPPYYITPAYSTMLLRHKRNKEKISLFQMLFSFRKLITKKNKKHNLFSISRTIILGRRLADWMDFSHHLSYFPFRKKQEICCGELRD